MRAYVAVSWAQLGDLEVHGELPAGLRACAVDPQWRMGSAEVAEEEWEFEAQSEASAALPSSGGAVLAVEVASITELVDGWGVLAEPVLLRNIGALMDRDLSWYGVQELDRLLGTQPPSG